MSQDLENNLLNNSTNSSFPNLSDSTLSFLSDERQHSTGTVKTDNVEKENSSKDNTTVIIGEDSSSGEVILISSDSEGIFLCFLLFC